MYQDSFKVKIDKDEYLVKYPNVGQQLEIENLKNLLSDGKYSQYAQVGSKTSTQLLDLIDAVSYFHTLIPELKEKLSVKNFTSIDPVFQKKLSKAFMNFYSNFILKVEEEISKELSEEDETTE